MTTYRVETLEGALLDAAVAKAEGFRFALGTNRAGDTPLAYVFTERRTEEFPDGQPVIYSPSSGWSEAGRIIERSEISLFAGRTGGINEAPYWGAMVGYASSHEPGFIERGDVATWHDGGPLESQRFHGRTPLMAAMRAFVHSKLGNEVDL